MSRWPRKRIVSTPVTAEEVVESQTAAHLRRFLYAYAEYLREQGVRARTQRS